jgi:hypothetical protein
MESFVTRRDCILKPSPLATVQLRLQRSGDLHYFSRLGRQQLEMTIFTRLFVFLMMARGKIIPEFMEEMNEGAVEIIADLRSC